MTDETRETAALLCQLMASNGGYDFLPACASAGEDLSSSAADVARRALWSVANGPNLDPDGSDRTWWAEAEARLRTGWTPEAP